MGSFLIKKLLRNKICLIGWEKKRRKKSNFTATVLRWEQTCEFYLFFLARFVDLSIFIYWISWLALFFWIYALIYFILFYFIFLCFTVALVMAAGYGCHGAKNILVFVMHKKGLNFFSCSPEIPPVFFKHLINPRCAGDRENSNILLELLKEHGPLYFT